MGLYKRLSENRNEVRRYNAARRKAEKFSSSPSSRLIQMETISEIERFNLAKDADRSTAFNKEIEHGKIPFPNNSKPLLHHVVYG